jgi:hypothetical protein
MNLNRNEILSIVGVFKVLPYTWISTLPKYYNFDYTSFMNRVNMARKQGYCEVTIARDDTKYITLTRKGYERVKSLIPLNYSFRGSNTLTRVDTIHRNHHRMIFYFLLAWIDYHFKLRGEYNIDSVFTDYEPNECRFSFKYAGLDIDLRPDMVLHPLHQDQESLICIEADTGTMSIPKLFNKIIRYGMYAKNDFEKSGIQKMKVYFSFQSDKRANNVFRYPKLKKQDGLLYELFNQGLVLKYISEKGKAQIRTADFIKVLKEDKLEFYSGTEHMAFDEYTKVDFLDNISQTCDKLEKYKLI